MSWSFFKADVQDVFNIEFYLEEFNNPAVINKYIERIPCASSGARILSNINEEGLTSLACSHG